MISGRSSLTIAFPYARVAAVFEQRALTEREYMECTAQLVRLRSVLTSFFVMAMKTSIEMSSEIGKALPVVLGTKLKPLRRR